MQRMRHMAILIIAFLLSCSTFLGCAFVDQKVDLTYERLLIASGGYGDLFIAKAKEQHNLERKGSGVIIGTVKNTYGMKTADVVTFDNVGDWIVNALSQELSSAGYNVKTVLVLPSDVIRGLNVTVLRLYVDQDPGFWTVGAITDLHFIVKAWRNGSKIKSFTLVAKGDDRSVAGSPKTKGISLRKALQSAMKQVVPEIVKTFD